MSAKTCGTCGETKAASGFYSDKSKPDGLTTQCKPCKREGNNRWRATNPDKVREAKSAWSATRTPESRRAEYAKRADAAKEYSRRWYADNRERAQEASRARYAEQRPQILATGAARRAAAPIYHAWRACGAHAKARGCVVLTLTLDEYRALMPPGVVCTYCGTPRAERPVRFGLDHIVPIVAGGPHTRENVTPYCLRCNTEKHDRPLAEWLADLALIEQGRKRCTTCWRIKDLDDFHRLQAGRGGRSPKCKTCKHEYDVGRKAA